MTPLGDEEGIGPSGEVDCRQMSFEFEREACRDGGRHADPILASYLRSIGTFGRLSPEAESHLARAISESQLGLRRQLHRIGWYAAHLIGRFRADLPEVDRSKTGRGLLRKLEAAESALSAADAAFLEWDGARTACSEARFEQALELLNERCGELDLKPSAYADFWEVCRLASSSGLDARAWWSQPEDVPQVLGRVRQFERNFLESRSRMVECNLRLVVSEAKKYVSGGMSLLDLVQEGNLSILRAAELFDYRRKTRFSTYAVTRLRADLLRVLDNRARAVRIPVHMCEITRRVKKVTRDLQQQLGVEPELALVADAAQLELSQVLEVRAMQQPVLSLQQPLRDGESATWEEVLPAEGGIDFAAQEHTSELLARLNACLCLLSEAECSVIRLRFGICGVQFASVAEVASQLQMSEASVRAIEKRALGIVARSWRELLSAA